MSVAERKTLTTAAMETAGNSTQSNSSHQRNDTAAGQTQSQNAASFSCSQCHGGFNSSSFSKAQLKKKDTERSCRVCIEGGKSKDANDSMKQGNSHEASKKLSSGKNSNDGKVDDQIHVGSADVVDEGAGFEEGAEVVKTWPRNLQDYVQRAFLACYTEHERNVVEWHLRDIIVKTTEQGTLYTRDWSKENLPPRSFDPSGVFGSQDHSLPHGGNSVTGNSPSPKVLSESSVRDDEHTNNVTTPAAKSTDAKFPTTETAKAQAGTKINGKPEPIVEVARATSVAVPKAGDATHDSNGSTTDGKTTVEGSIAVESDDGNSDGADDAVNKSSKKKRRKKKRGTSHTVLDVDALHEAYAADKCLLDAPSVLCGSCGASVIKSLFSKTQQRKPAAERQCLACCDATSQTTRVFGQTALLADSDDVTAMEVYAIECLALGNRINREIPIVEHRSVFWYVEAAWGFENTLHKRKSQARECTIRSELYIKLAESYKLVAEHFNALIACKTMSTVGWGRVSVFGHISFCVFVAAYQYYMKKVHMYVTIAVASVGSALDLRLGKLAAQVKVNNGDDESAMQIYAKVMSRDDPMSAKVTLTQFSKLKGRIKNHTMAFASAKELYWKKQFQQAYTIVRDGLSGVLYYHNEDMQYMGPGLTLEETLWAWTIQEGVGLHGPDNLSFGASSDRRLKFAKMVLFVDMHTPVEEGAMPPLYPPVQANLQDTFSEIFGDSLKHYMCIPVTSLYEFLPPPESGFNDARPPEAYYAAGVYAYAVGEYGIAVEFLEAALERHQGYHDARVLLRSGVKAIGDLQRKAYECVVSKPPPSTVALEEAKTALLQALALALNASGKTETPTRNQVTRVQVQLVFSLSVVCKGLGGKALEVACNHLDSLLGAPAQNMHELWKGGIPIGHIFRLLCRRTQINFLLKRFQQAANDGAAAEEFYFETHIDYFDELENTDESYEQYLDEVLETLRMARRELWRLKRVDYYKILQVDRFATDAEIKAAYRARAKECHPDRLVGKDAKSAGETAFKQVGTAYAVLGNAKKRMAYDQEMARGYVSEDEDDEEYDDDEDYEDDHSCTCGKPHYAHGGGDGYTYEFDEEYDGDDVYDDVPFDEQDFIMNMFFWAHMQNSRGGDAAGVPPGGTGNRGAHAKSAEPTGGTSATASGSNGDGRQFPTTLYGLDVAQNAKAFGMSESEVVQRAETLATQVVACISAWPSTLPRDRPQWPTVEALAATFNMKPAMMTNILTGLETAGRVVKRIDGDGGRQWKPGPKSQR
eukprot:m.153868 g.153868  ORF g.153868 m.153868 type:complete len:1269 (-) comp17920_c0_seq12:3351-7157(-)